MRSKAPLVLMEQLVMVLVFALAAALCLRAFVLADHISAHSGERDWAVLQAQNAAEIWKSCAGDGDSGTQLEHAAARLGGTVEQGCLSVRYDAEKNRIDSAAVWTYQVSLMEEPSETAGLRQAVVMVHGDEGAPLFTLEIACQEAAG